MRQAGAEGASAVEFAIILIPLFLVIFGGIEFGMAFWRTQTMEAGAREGARLGAVEATVDQIVARAGDALSGAVSPSDVQMRVERLSDAAPPAVLAAWTSSSSDVPCGVPAADAVRVHLKILPDLQDEYGVQIPFGPTRHLSHEATGVFRCE